MNLDKLAQANDLAEKIIKLDNALDEINKIPDLYIRLIKDGNVRVYMKGFLTEEENLEIIEQFKAILLEKKKEAERQFKLL